MSHSAFGLVHIRILWDSPVSLESPVAKTVVGIAAYIPSMSRKRRSWQSYQRSVLLADQPGQAEARVTQLLSSQVAWLASTIAGDIWPIWSLRVRVARDQECTK